MQEGIDEDKLMAMDRSELLEAMTAAMFSAEMAKAAATPSADDDAHIQGSEARSEVRKMRELEWEKRKFMAITEEKRAEREERRAEREAEERKAERDERRFEHEFELRKMEHEQTKISNEMKMIEMKAMREEDVEVVGDESQSGEVESPKRGMTITCTNTLRKNMWRTEPKSMGTQCGMFCKKCPLKTRSFLNFLRLWKRFFRYTKFLTISWQNCSFHCLRRKPNHWLTSCLSRKLAISPS